MEEDTEEREDNKGEDIGGEKPLCGGFCEGSADDDEEEEEEEEGISGERIGRLLPNEDSYRVPIINPSQFAEDARLLSSPVHQRRSSRYPPPHRCSASVSLSASTFVTIGGSVLSPPRRLTGLTGDSSLLWNIAGVLGQI